jgi:plasmid stabilization system protein ParE
MPDQTLLALAREARDRAEEILAIAETFHDAYAKHKMREIAVKYEELAERLEQAAERCIRYRSKIAIVVDGDPGVV